MLARFSTIPTKYSSRVRTMIGAVTEILPDNSFKTRCILGGKDGFGRDNSNGLYTWQYENPNYKSSISIVKPNAPYELFEETDNFKECNLLAIKYYMGTDYNDVIKVLDKRMFIVEEKHIVSERIPNTLPEEYTVGRFNEILQYTGWEHLPKENPKYEGDAYTRIELSKECPVTMYKLIGIKEPIKL